MTLSKKLKSEFETILEDAKAEILASVALEDLADIQTTAKEEFKEAAKKLDDLSEVADAESVIEELKYTGLDDRDADILLSYICENNGVEKITEFLAGNGYAVIKIDTMEQQSKLREFIEAELYPSYSERKFWAV